ncbi:glycerophosphodiester phosphodiesterase family protein [Furfurilactobacillus siliginis]|uniref:Glycerophosphoryl diester phosphodiesterase n=1 Tax=Furfurilactobacillus siliginis TaxID=348151 RepID=A0A0R2L8K5_9LACO|nr:glycerophosphodiester phosphodiesterase family protein [Furfurilactobacillus siliginis]KRN95063.1 glycerophosphoryl diester phosphodiesterase [Furfurilactobacillus siliginis]GEK28317.1 glycerophosphoryl diester phosphodiesterase [Furfurilactobacillus siliginis]
MKTAIIAHRGLTSSAPANTMAAFAAAMAVGVDGIETDVQQSADGQLVLMHDERVDKLTTGRGLLKQYSLADLRRLSFVGYPGCQIPTLSELLTFLTVRHFTGLLNLELKTQHVRYPHIEAHLAALINGQKWPFKIVVSSFSATALRRFKKLAPTIDTALLFRCQSLQGRWLVHQGIINAYHPKWWWSKRRHHQGNVDWRVWTVNTKVRLERCFEQEVAAVITDQTVLAQQIRSQIQGETRI